MVVELVEQLDKIALVSLVLQILVAVVVEHPSEVEIKWDRRLWVVMECLGTLATGGTITQNGGYTIHSFTQVGNSNLTFQSASGTGTSTVSVDEEVAVGTLVANLTATVLIPQALPSVLSVVMDLMISITPLLLSRVHSF